MEPELKKFAHEIGKTVFFGVRSDIEVVYICKFEPENPIITTATVGSRIPMYCTSLGKAILAYSEPEILQPLLKRMTFVKRTEHTITDPDRLMQELEQVREQGFALDAREMQNAWENRYLGQMEDWWEQSVFQRCTGMSSTMKNWGRLY